MKSLVIYFSHTGENYAKYGIKNITEGNTEVIAKKLLVFVMLIYLKQKVKNLTLITIGSAVTTLKNNGNITFAQH